MVDDLVIRLAETAARHVDVAGVAEALDAAIDEILRLRQALEIAATDGFWHVPASLHH